MGVPEPSLAHALSITCCATAARKALVFLPTLLQMEPFVEPLMRMRLGLDWVLAGYLESLPLVAGLTPLTACCEPLSVDVDSCANSVVVEAQRINPVQDQSAGAGVFVWPLGMPAPMVG